MTRLPSTAAAGTSRYAVVRAAGLTFAVTAGDVVQALPLEHPHTHLPRTGSTLWGVIQHGGRVLPVVDLSRWEGLLQRHAAGDPSEAASQVLVLAHGGRTTAIVIEATVGMVVSEHGACHAVHHDSAPGELFHSVLNLGPAQPPLAVLDTDRLMRQTAVWVEASPWVQQALDHAPSRAAHAEDAGPGADVQPWVVVALAGRHVALPVHAVATVLPTPAIQGLAGLVAGLQGVCTVGARQLPVVRIHEMLGLVPPPAGAREALLLVVRVGGRALGVLIDHVVAVRRLAAGPRTDGGALVCAVVTDPGAPDGLPLHLLSAEALLRAYPLAELGDSDAQAGQDGGHPGAATAGFPQPLVVFRAGRSMATPLRDLLEIVRAEASDAHAPSESPRHLRWRDRMVPLEDLRLTMEGVASEGGPERRVLIVRHGAGVRALLVESVIELVPSYVGTVSELPCGAKRRLTKLTMLTTHVAGIPSSYEIVRLVQDPLDAAELQQAQ